MDKISFFDALYAHNVPFYRMNGEEGVLLDRDDAVAYGVDLSALKESEYCNYDVWFVPASRITDPLANALLSGECKARAIYSDEYDYYGTAYGDNIAIHACVNFENDQRLEDRWESDTFAKDDLARRMLYTETTQYHDWQSLRTAITRQIGTCDNDAILDMLRDEWTDAVDTYDFASDLHGDWQVPTFDDLVAEARD